MKFRHLKAEVFGPLQKREFDLSGPIELICGPNESGKSSFRAALDTVLFGFEPARRETHPLFQWNETGGNLHLEAEVELDSSERFTVERVLLSSGKSRVAEPGEEFSGTRGGNGPLEGIEETPRDLFRSVYSLAVDDLAALDQGVQAQVDHLLLPAFGHESLRPIRRVLSELRKEHQSLWRPDQRGKTRAQKLSKELYQARHDLREAADEEEQLREAVTEQADLAVRSDRFRERRKRLERAEREAPFLKRLFELDYRRRAAPAAVDLAPLEGETLIDPATLSEEIRQLEDQLEGPRSRLEREALHLTPREQLLVERGAEIDVAARDRVELEALESAHRDLLERSGRLGDRRDLELRSMGTPDAAALGALSLEVLRSQREAWELAREEAAAIPPPKIVDLPALAGLVLGLSALGAAAVSLTEPGPRATVAALGLAALGWALLRVAQRSTPAPPAPIPLAEETSAQLEQAGIDPALYATPAALQRAIDALDRLRRIEDEASGVRQRIEADDVRCAEITGRWTELGREFGEDHKSGAEAIAELEHQRARALEQSNAVRVDENERHIAREAIATLGPTLASRCKRRERIERALRLNQPRCADLTQAFEEVQRRLQEEAWVRQQQTELERDPLWKSLKDDPRGRADSDPTGAPWDPKLHRERRAELARIDEERSGVDRRLGEISQMLAADPGARQARVQETARRLESEIVEVGRQRDRLALLERILEHADHLFREAHQPDVLRRAGSYLELVTGGRYTRLDADVDTRGGLRVFNAERNVAVAVGPPLSRGTRDQIHLCLRLGLLDHLDDEREKLPLVLDEVLVHWDTERRMAMYPLLEKVAETRQVFLLTCHEWLAEETERALGIGRHNLAGEAAEVGETS